LGFLFKKVKKAIVSDDFKPNSAAVTLNFLMRKGLVTIDHSKKFQNFIFIYFLSIFIDSKQFFQVPNYLELLENLHAPGF